VGLSYLEHLVDVGSAAHHHFGPLVHVCGLHRPPGRGTAEDRRRLAAVYGIICFVNVPLVFFSTRWWRSIHPVVISSEGMGLTAKMRVAMFLSVGVFSLLYLYLLKTRMKSLMLQERVARLKAELMA